MQVRQDISPIVMNVLGSLLPILSSNSEVQGDLEAVLILGMGLVSPNCWNRGGDKLVPLETNCDRGSISRFWKIALSH